MRYSVQYSRRFKKSLQKVKQQPGFDSAKLKKVVTLLASGESLPATYKDHALKGQLKDFRACHLAPDILLIYQVTKGVLMLTLVNIGSHAQLFNK